MEVPKHLDSIYVFIPGKGSFTVAVVGGKAEYSLPPDVLGGTVIVVSDGRIPNPTSVTVTVVGGESR